MLHDVVAMFLIVYAVLALGHIAVQMLLSHVDHRRQSRQSFVDHIAGSVPSVTAIVPVYNEEPEILDACLASFVDQDLTELQVLVVDDGSENRAEQEPLYRRYEALGLTVMRLEQNVGKRCAQKAAFDVATGDAIVTVDSDTVVPRGAIRQLLRRLTDQDVGAVTGDVRVSNDGTNFLTRLIACRYWMAFHQERAAQSLFGVMTCCSGPFSVFRRSIVEEVKDEYVAQRFLGQDCTFGDDRHLTNLVLAHGHRVVFDQSARAYTHVPETMPKFVKQQLRWSKSFYREALWTAKFTHRRHPYMATDLLLQIALPFMLIGALAVTVHRAIEWGPDTIWRYVAVLLAIGLIRGLYGFYRTRSPWFLAFVVYGVLHVLVLVPTRMVAIATIARGGWGTRSLPAGGG